MNGWPQWFTQHRRQCAQDSLWRVPEAFRRPKLADAYWDTPAGLSRWAEAELRKIAHQSENEFNRHARHCRIGRITLKEQA